MAFREMRFPAIPLHIERPDAAHFGDFSINIAMQLAPILKKPPREIADRIVEKLSKAPLFEKVEVAGPGFINLFLKKDVFLKEVAGILKKSETYGALRIGKTEKVNVEFISANPTGELHIGNGRGAFWGDVLSNVLRKAGYNVTREYYVQDAMASNQIRELGRTVLGEGSVYKTAYLEDKMKRLRVRLRKVNDPARAGHQMAKVIQKDIRRFVERTLRIHFDEWISEEALYKEGWVEKAHALLARKHLLYQKDGAQWVRTHDLGAPEDRVVVKQTGEPTYLLPDLAYHSHKFSRGFGRVINIWGADHQGHVKDMEALLTALAAKREAVFLISQLVRLKGGEKLSKRKGKIITLEELVGEIGLDVARFFYLEKSLDTQMEFDFKLAKEKSEKNPVYYVQYAHARIASILKKSETNPKHQIRNHKLGVLIHSSEIALIRELVTFPEIIEDTARDYQVQRLPHYSMRLADAFHRFYHECRVLSDDPSLTHARLALVRASQIVIKNTLTLMGIHAPLKM